MNLHTFTINKFTDEASKKFDSLQSSLSKLSSSFQTRLMGNSTGQLVARILGTGLWIALLFFGFSYLRPMISTSDDLGNILFVVSAISCTVLLGAMMIDNIISISYYGKLNTYAQSVLQLQSRITRAKTSIRANQDTFAGAKSKGWNYPLSVGASIPSEAHDLEGTLASMESLKAGFLHGLKNVAFYIAAVAISLMGSAILFDLANDIMGIDHEIANVISIIVAIIVAIVEIFLAKAVWGATDCTVNNITLLILPAGPVAFIALIAIGTLVVFLLMAVLEIALGLLGLFIAGACLFGSTCGG